MQVFFKLSRFSRMCLSILAENFLIFCQMTSFRSKSPRIKNNFWRMFYIKYFSSLKSGYYVANCMFCDKLNLKSIIYSFVYTFFMLIQCSRGKNNHDTMERQFFFSLIEIYPKIYSLKKNRKKKNHRINQEITVAHALTSIAYLI